MAKYHINTFDDVISRSIFLSGSFEDAVQLRKVLHILSRLGYADPRPGTFVDVGANIGSTCICAMTEFGFSGALAFEPESRNYRLLLQNLLENNLSNLVKTFNVALSDREGQVALDVDPINAGDHRVNVVGAPGGPARGAQCVSAATFDGLVHRGEIRVDDLSLAWLDAQGHEGHVLRGATSLLTRNVPVVAEFWPHELGPSGGLDFMEEIASTHFSHFIDLRRFEYNEDMNVVPSRKFNQLRDMYSVGVKEAYTDVLLLKL